MIRFTVARSFPSKREALEYISESPGFLITLEGSNQMKYWLDKGILDGAEAIALLFGIKLEELP